MAKSRRTSVERGEHQRRRSAPAAIAQAHLAHPMPTGHRNHAGNFVLHALLRRFGWNHGELAAHSQAAFALKVIGNQAVAAPLEFLQGLAAAIPR